MRSMLSMLEVLQDWTTLTRRGTQYTGVHEGPFKSRYTMDTRATHNGVSSVPYLVKDETQLFLQLISDISSYFSVVLLAASMLLTCVSCRGTLLKLKHAAAGTELTLL